jgi:gustatory receptor
MRAATTILMSSNIQRAARYPLEIFRTIPSEGWNEELERFFNQIKSHTNALSGLGFFSLTRKLQFGLGGALLTYELVLLQFNGSSVDWSQLVDCDEAFKML